MAKSSLFGKLTQLVNQTADNLLIKARNTGMTDTYKFKRKSIYIDDYSLNDQGVFTEKGTIIPFDILRQVASKDMIVLCVINKIMNRVAAFSRPQKDRYSLGYTFCLRNKDSELQEQDKQEIENLKMFIRKTGYDVEGRPKCDKRSFEAFLKLITWDSLVFNQVGIECVASKDGNLSYFIPVSGGSIRYAVKDLKEKIADLRGYLFDGLGEAQRQKIIEDTNKQIDDIKYVQVHKGQVYAAYTEKELILKHRVPSVDINNQGYPPGELEWLVNTVSSHRLAEVHNEVFFKQGHANNGILNIKSEMTEEDLQGVKRMLQRQSAGVRNAHRQLVFSAPNGIEWIAMSSMSNRDMEWHEWMQYLIKLICGVYGINPAEINFDISKDSSTSLGDGGYRNEVMLKDTRNSILRPLLNWIEDIINDEILPRYNPEMAEKYAFEFVGLESQDEDKELDRIKKKVTTIYTVNEIRKELGLEALPSGDIILDSIYLQNVSNEQMAQQSQQMEEGVEMGGEQSAPGVETQEEQIGNEEEFSLDNAFKSTMSQDKTEASTALDKIKKSIRIEWIK